MRLPFQRQNQTSDASDIASMFTGGVHQVTPQGHDFESGQVSNLQPVVQMIIRKFMVPWLLSVLKKYNEQQFHQMMSYPYVDSSGRTAQGRDFMTDLEANHRTKLNMFMKVARKNRKLFNVDIDYETRQIVAILQRRGWTVYAHEIQCFKDTLYKFMRRIYS